MKEKKLTDEEIVKALEFCVKNDCEKCPYLIKGFDCVISKQAENDFLDLIHRLQDENKRLKKDVHDMSWIIKVHKYCVGPDHCQNSSTREFELQKQVDELNAKNEHLDSENTRLICEMDKMLDDGWDIMDEEADGWYKKGCKDTAKEILQGVNKWLKQAISDSYDKSVNGSIRHGGMNTAFHEVKELLKKVAKEKGIEVE